MISSPDICLFLRDHRTKSIIDIQVYAPHILEPNHIGERIDRRLQPCFHQPSVLALSNTRQDIGKVILRQRRAMMQPDIIDRIIVLALQQIWIIRTQNQQAVVHRHHLTNHTR